MMTDLILWSVMLWAVAAILLHLGLIGYATICRNSNWWGSPWEVWAERLRWYIEHPDALAAAEQRIRTHYQPASWSACAASILGASITRAHAA